MSVARASSAVVLATCALLTGAQVSAAQAVDVIRGQVTGPDRAPVEHATITATSIGSGVNRKAYSDKDGRYTIIFPGGAGDYLISIAALGLAPQRFELKRTADQDILVADAQLSPAVAVLDSVHVRVPRERVARGLDTLADMSGTEHVGTLSSVPADDQGDLNALAGTIPGVTAMLGASGEPAGFSVFGLGADQNTTTLNGSPFAGASVPRDASITATVVTTPYDVSRGGFSGAQLNIRSTPGSNFIRRSSSLLINTPALEWTDPVAQALGQQYTHVSLSGVLAGPIVYDQAFYNISYQLDQRSSDVQSLLNSSALALESSGIATDSVRRLRQLLAAQGIPIGDAHSPSRISENASVFGSVDVAPQASSSGQTFNLTFSGSWGRQNAAGESIRTMPAQGADRRNLSGNVQMSESAYLHETVLTENTIGLTTTRTSTSPYVLLPSAGVLVHSNFADGTSGVSTVGFGGGGSGDASATQLGFVARDQLSWFARDNKHRLKLSTEFQEDAYDQQPGVSLGAFRFGSLADLEGNTPTSYTRLLGVPTARGRRVALSLALGDSYRWSDALQLQIGLRADAERYLVTPADNGAIDSLFGTSNAAVPNRLYVSPRVGFSWSYGHTPQISPFAGAANAPRAVIRGGVGVFQDVPGASLVSDAIANTGLPGLLRQLSCVGAAVPAPEWATYGADPAAIPTTCADGTTATALAASVPDVVLFSRGYTAPRSIRSNVQWSGPIAASRFALTAEATYSRNVHQPRFVDLNFRPAVRFALSDEAGRPVFVPPEAIVPNSGLIAASQARVTPQYGHVGEELSDLSGDTKQLQLSLSPMRFSQTFHWSVSYVYAIARSQVGGFSSTTADPFGVSWARSGLDARHQVSYSLDYNLFDALRVHWFGRFSSGAPFTPMIADDVNGDGYINDRAFVFDPRTAPDSSVATAMQSLLASSGSRVRTCLGRQRGQLAATNSCEGPWIATAALSLALNPLKFHLPQRAAVSLNVANPLGAADILLHGEHQLHGWGRPAIPDPTLLYVTGFDATHDAFRYQVNPRFGSTSPRIQQIRAPVVATLMIRFDLGPSRERQTLMQALDQGRAHAGQRLSASALKLSYASSGIINPMLQMLRQGDLLQLTGPQADSLATMNRQYTIRVDALWNTTASYWAQLPADFDRDQAYAHYTHAREATVDLLIALAPRINAVLTPAQKRRLPPVISSYIDVGYLRQIRSSTVGGAASGALATP